MKTQVHFSIESKIANEICMIAERNRVKPSRIFQRIAEEWYQKHTAKIIKCQTCGAEYSSIYEKCPQCKVMEMQEAEKTKLETQIKQKAEKVEKLEKRLKQAKETFERGSYSADEYCNIEKRVIEEIEETKKLK